jgi:hypothetical protein
MIIPFVIGTSQSDLSGGALFALSHLKTLRSITSDFSSYLFSSIADNTHIIDPLSMVSFAYEHLQIELCAISFSTQMFTSAPWWRRKQSSALFSKTIGGESKAK